MTYRFFLADGIHHRYGDGGQKYVQEYVCSDKPVQDWHKDKQTQYQAKKDEKSFL
jgi:hypothetical protein